MNINQTTPNFQAKMPKKNLVPISGYKGPVLQLTQAEQLQVGQMQDRICQFTDELTKIKAELKRKGKISTAYRQSFKDKINSLEKQITNLTQSIRDIKVNRFNQQKQAFDKELYVLA